MKKYIVNKINYAIKERKMLVISCIIVFLMSFIYASFLFNKTMMPTEGWYTYYGYIMNERGAIPYLDFELLFPPLYTYMIAFFTNIFGYNIISLRILGIFIYSFTGVFAFLIFQKLTNNNFLGIIGGVLTISVLQSESVQIFYDYIRVMDLFIYISIYFFIRYLSEKNNNNSKLNINIILGTIFAVLASMCKQSSGLIYLLFCLIFCLFLYIFDSSKKDMLYQFKIMLLIVIVMYGIMMLFLVNQGSFINYIKYNFVSSIDAKGAGSILNLLFGWIFRLRGYIGYGITFVVVLVLLLIIEISLCKDFPIKKNNISKAVLNKYYLLVVIILFLSIILPVICSGYAYVMSKFMNKIALYSLFLFSTLFFAIMSFIIIYRKFKSGIKWDNHYKYYFLSGVIFVLGYAVEMSGSLSESQTALAFSFVPILLIKMAKFKKREIFIGVLIFNMIFQTCISFSYKIVNTYDWWKLKAGTYYDQRYTSDIPIFKGIKMSDRYVKMYDDIYKVVMEKTNVDDKIFVFPHIPILYVATDRDRVSNTAIQWFDVASDKAIIDDIDIISEKKPKVIVMMKIPDFTLDIHENMFRNGNKSGLHQMQDFLNYFVLTEGYSLYDSYNICNYYLVSLWILE